MHNFGLILKDLKGVTVMRSLLLPSRPSGARGRAAALAAAALVAVLAAGCGGDEPEPEASGGEPAPSASATPGAGGQSSGAADVPQGYKAYGGADVGAQIALPEGWQDLPIGPEAERVLQERLQLDPAQEAAIKQQLQQMQSQGAFLFAVDPASAQTSQTGFSTNASLMRVPVRSADAQQLTGELEQALGANPGIQGLQISPVTLPAGDAVLARYQLQNTVDVHYYAVPNGQGEAILMVLSTDQPDTYGQTLESIAQTLKLT